jgi:hypothetical protein
LIAHSYNWKNGNCDYGDAQKFRGRGFKQLTGRSNYADYCYIAVGFHRLAFLPHGGPIRNLWLKIGRVSKQYRRNSQFSRHCYTDNCIDSWAWFIAAFRPAVLRAIDNDAPAIASTSAQRRAESNIVEEITKKINGGKVGFNDRLNFTRIIKDVLL